MSQCLDPWATTALELDNSERIQRIRAGCWISYGRAARILEKLDDLLTHPQTHRMPNLLLVGETNNGKTMLANQFLKEHPQSKNPGGEGIIVPVLMVQAPPVPDERRFLAAILERLYAPYRASGRIEERQSQVVSLLRLVGLRVLVIDEIQHILAGNDLKRNHFLNTIKYLANELKICIVGVGISTAFNAINSDAQLANRFDHAPLPRWKMDNEYRRLLKSFEKYLALRKPSNLTDQELPLKLLNMSEGTIGEIWAILTRASIKAIKTGEEQITSETLDAIEWLSPSKRRKGPLLV
ncbi:MAG: TniB family NTP-binding protein [Candidatus Eremiobacteraeota bacterium]|nr:TniB family NTP-binding protein [Candidatus Eremiobacteraeota bacterium]